ncbi:MAG: hypothetical protein NTV46_00980 [Verrucomicrobia bacterium]|nr:hypothetical protein [Verrucomicrobiota bacterium]
MAYTFDNNGKDESSHDRKRTTSRSPTLQKLVGGATGRGNHHSRKPIPARSIAIKQELQSRCIGESEIAALERHAQTAAITAKRRITFALFVFIVSALLSSLIALLFGIGDISRGVPAFPPIGFLEAAWGAYGIYVVTKLWRKRYGAPDHAVWLVRLSIPLNILSLLSRNTTDSGALGGAIIVSINQREFLKFIHPSRSRKRATPKSNKARLDNRPKAFQSHDSISFPSLAGASALTFD